MFIRSPQEICVYAYRRIEESWQVKLTLSNYFTSVYKEGVAV